MNRATGRFGAVQLVCGTAILAALAGAAAAAEPDGAAPLRPGTPLASLSATRERPLFAPTRRPRPLPPAPQPTTVALPKPASVEEQPHFALLGIIRTPDRGGSVVLMDEVGRTPFTLKLGEARRGWVLQALDADAVTVAKDGRTVRLSYAKVPQPPRTPGN